MKVLGIIPARFGSTRFPGKPLAKIIDKTMIHHVYERISRAPELTQIVVATDDERIAQNVRSFNGQVMMTSSRHQSGTDRCQEVAEKWSDFDIIVNIQGDEPLIDPVQISQVLECFDNPSCNIATLVKGVEKPEEAKSPNMVKVVFDTNMKALYFSRSVIPFKRNSSNHHPEYWHHVGLYAYRSETLEAITKLPVSNLERIESLEQLRWLENGYSIYVNSTNCTSTSVDSPEDIKRIESILRSY